LLCIFYCVDCWRYSPTLGSHGAVRAWGVMLFVRRLPLWWLLVGMAGLVVLAGHFAISNFRTLARRIDALLVADIDPRTQLGLCH